jgi:hypothetical protein
VSEAWGVVILVAFVAVACYAVREVRKKRRY